MLQTVQNNQLIINASEKPLANSSSSTFGAKTVLSAGKQIVSALLCISLQLQQASDLTTAPDAKANYKKIQDKIAGHVQAINGPLAQLSGPNANRQTAIDAAGGLNVLLVGAPSVTGVNSTVNDAVHILGG
jgi:hypothetical protein